jgi:acetylornithine aminotransferase/acetylornithine/N-succinyldiaminopimelate aminotransferase
MSLKSVAQAEGALLLATYDRHPVLFTRGRGVYLWDDEEKRYLDFLSGIGVNALGHAHPKVQAVLRKQGKRLIHVSNLFFHEYQAELAAKLTRLSGLDRAFFCNSGTEAWEGALKIARAYAKHHADGKARAKWRILAMENSFHGRTMGALATTGQAKYRAPFEPLVPGVRFVHFNDCADLPRKFDDSVCAVCIETVQGEGGVRPATPEFLGLVRKLASKKKALLIADEIQCGLGRTGRFFAYQHYDVRPDIVTVAKPLAAGLPLGAILLTNRVAEAIHSGMHGTTFGGGPLACAVALATVEELEKQLEHVNQISSVFLDQLKVLAAKHACIENVRGLGLMLAIELDSADRAKEIVKTLLGKGIIINRTADKVLRFLPPYIIRKKHVAEVVHALDEALQASSRVATLTKPVTARRSAA